ncbi:hypothetical protein NW754_011775 [Fusarium falciforme]|uniref:Uncharacterized protein n=1 Tax=Fusarium falciforme TaxID=195108 RepID=A0A9W8UZH5_9HYPO|nr:Hypothetical protein NCS54_01149700 [Fusarium falciforme]KAJ4167960.1 hypothetical protein NW754_011775 [Fusarium falciforme]KAJ4187271.1 hypothetical protein NW755_007364 [Fusarium falciforme]KAJ4201938.1 hypothetical protein NW767_006473 [Fusarium falciforme]KAJ4250819.1 hypothetical protein NW757_007019 [Fusarium falciforme]WAO93937.1 Hypothetical protein NCS54_01149700 [Fusarium falciforme]
MTYSEPVRVFPCLFCWTPEVKCPNYVFLNKSACVDCQRLGRQHGGNELIATDVHETFVRYLLDKYSEGGGITYERVNEYISSARQVNVDNLLTVALDYIYRNFRGLYHLVCDAVEAARDRGPIQWTPINLAERLERIRTERERQRRGNTPL